MKKVCTPALFTSMEEARVDRETHQRLRRVTLTRRTEQSPPIDQTDRAIELWGTIESIDEQVTQTGVERTHFEVH